MSRHAGKPVLVVGTGPVGFCTALRLAQAGVPVTLIEQDAELQDDLRASTFHPPTLEMLDELALTRGLLDEGLRTDKWQIRLHETHEKAEFDLDAIRDDTRYPFRLQVEQRVLCRLAAEKVAAEPLIDLRMNTELLAFKQNDKCVQARLRSPDGDLYEISTPFMIAADGAKSITRKLLDLPFEGLTYPEMTILATTHFPFQKHLPGLSNVNYVWYSGGTFSLLRLPDVWRVSLYPDENESEAESLEAASLQRKLQRVVPRDESYVVEESRPYRIHQRIVSDYRAGRILLVGDAAHLNSPSGGMGMNGGIHDAFNLTEKLPLVWRGGAEPESLDLYTRQRRPIAREQILQQAHANRTRMQERDPRKRRAELARLQAIAGDPQQSREYLLRSSMITGLREAKALT
ncbi:MAG: FAD-dependent monooxygenase [Gammaproteobacteria bacterium]|nr:FAD-dependent monooxygenase [Gammaproteobacteria bacterium]